MAIAIYSASHSTGPSETVCLANLVTSLKESENCCFARNASDDARQTEWIVLINGVHREGSQVTIAFDDSRSLRIIEYH